LSCCGFEPFHFAEKDVTVARKSGAPGNWANFSWSTGEQLAAVSSYLGFPNLLLTVAFFATWGYL
jgi:hypothetical protein